jgi:hypothetical protein
MTMLMRTKKDVTVQWRSQNFPGGSHGAITVPKGTRVSPIKADPKSKEAPAECFVDQFGFLPQNLRQVAFRYGIRVPAADCEQFISLARGVDLMIQDYAGRSGACDGGSEVFAQAARVYGDDERTEQRGVGR